MIIEGEEKTIKLTIDDAKEDDIIQNLMAMNGVKTIDKEESNVKIEALGD